MEKELLSVVTTFNKFCPLLLGAEIHVFTDHNNLIYSTVSTLNTERVLCWRLFLEDYAPVFQIRLIPDHILAEFLSCYALAEKDSTSDSHNLGPVPSKSILKINEYFELIQSR